MPSQRDDIILPLHTKRQLTAVLSNLRRAEQELDAAAALLTPYAPKKAAVIEHLQDQVSGLMPTVESLRDGPR